MQSVLAQPMECKEEKINCDVCYFLSLSLSLCGAAPGGTEPTLRWASRGPHPPSRCWGCEITSGHGTSVQENHLLGILERAISRWSPFVRGFSLVGRARAANSLVLAAVLHHLHGYLPGDATIAKLQARLTRFVWGSCHRAAWLPGGLLARPVSVGGVGLLDIRTQLQLACFKGVQAASRNGGKNAYSWLVESGAWMTSLSSGSWLLPRHRRLLDLWGQASSILGLNHRVLPAPTLLNLPLVGACRFLATPSLRAPSRWRGFRVRDLAGPAPPPIARLTRSACEDAAALGAFCQRLVADNATSVYRERTLEEAVVLRGTATPFLRISTRTARRMLERPRLAAVPISRYLRRWAPVVDVPSTSLAFSSLRRCSFGGHAADIALRLALHALPHPGHPASSQPVCIACRSSDLSLAHRYWSCSAVRPLIREVFSIIGRPPDLQSWIFAVNLENHAITIPSAAKHAIYVFFVDREMRGISGDPLAIFHQTLQRWQRRHMSIKICQLSLSLSLLSSGSWLLPRRRRLLDLWEQASSILGLNHRVVPAPTLLNLPLVGACRFLATPSLRVPSRWRGVRVRDLADPASPPVARLTRSACEDAAALGAFCQRLVADNATSVYRERTLEEAVVLRGTATPFLRISTRTARRMLERPRLAALPISRFLRRWAPVVGVPSASTPCSSLRRCSFGGHAADIALRQALHALPHPGHPASSQPVCIACGSSDLSLAHRYWSCSAVRPLIREAFSIIGRPPDLQSWIFAVGLEDHAITISSAAKHAIYVFFVDREMRGVAGDPLAIFHHTLQRWQRRHNGSDANRAAETIDKNVNRADQVEAADKDEDPTPFIQVKKRKASPPKSQPTKVAKSESSAPKPAGNTRVFNRNPVAAIKNTRQQQQINKARSAAASFDQGCFIEWCPDFDHLCYMRALEEKLGRGSVFQLMRMSGHMLASLSSVEKAERLIEDGLTIGDTILRAFPYRKRAEKIIIGNLPIAVKEEDIVATLRPYCRVVSLAIEIVNCEGYSWATGNREAFILMNDGMKLHQLPGKVDIKSKGETTPAFITHGVKCSMCHRQGHRRASCPKRDREERPTIQQTPRQDPARLPPTTQTPSSAALAVTPPAALGRPQETPSKSVSAPTASTPVQPTPATSAAKSPAEGVSFSSKVSEAKLAVPTLPLPSVPRVQEESSREEETPKKASLALEQLKPVLERLPDTIFKGIETAGVGRGRVIQAIANKGPMKALIAALNPEQAACLTDLTTKSVELCCFLKQHAVDVAFVQETNVLALNNVRDLCLGYSAVFAPSSTPRGSGLAVILAPGVTVLWHRVLWPGKIAIASVKIRGLETRVINCHLSHTPEERHLQLQIIAEEAIREDAWALGDINISEESSSDIGSGAVEAFAELLDRTALVDIAAIFDAAHLPTRVASYGSRVDAARLDRVLIPSRLSGRVTRYWTLNYRNSDHRAILLQVGDPPSPPAPSISALLRSAPVIERIEALLSEASQEIEGIRTGDLWGKWGKLKRELVEDIKCLYVPRVEDEDYVTRASRFLRSRLEAETVEADYPSLPELGRALRVRQHRPELTTVFDAQGNLFEGKSLRRYVFNSFRELFNGSTCSPEDIAGFLEGATECITLEDSDPLHRADISLNEVEVAISRLPQGKAAGCDGIPCELVKGFEDFFGGVIHQVLAESKLRGTLPESSRRNIICLVPKAHGGPGLSGYRPISLPTADYRIVSGVLLGRLRRHLPAIVPDCQTYAVPGRCPSWNIACVSDEVAQAFKNKTPLAVISTDLQSAFDNVDREFLASQLRIIGLPPPFMEWLHLLYAEADATIKVDGNFTRPFKMRRGLRQGCACSAALFSIFTGPLLRHLERILGRGNVLAYADDILLLIREDWQFERVKTIFDEFRRASGVSVNFPKSKGLWCGAWRDRADSPLGISWSASSITVLGCEITSGHGTSVQENHLLGILERSISRWSPFVRGFSLVGRARAANSLVLAAVLHHLHGYLPGDATIAKLQARLTRFVWGSCHRAAWLPGGLLARPVSVGGVGLLDIRTQLQLACFKGVQAASRNGGKNAYSWLVESGAWMTPLSSGSWLLPRRRRLLDLWEQASSILGLNHRVVPAPTLLNLPLVGACRFLATPSLRAPSRWRGVRVRDLAGPAPPPIARLTRSTCDDAAALGAFCQRLVADNATSVYRERTLEEAVVLRGTATPFLRISTRTARRMLERPRLAAVPISRYLRRWAPVVDVPSTSLAFSSLRRCSFGGHAADIALRLALHALPHPGHPASSQPVCIACGSSDLSLAHRYWSCSAVRPLIREVFSIIGRPPDLQSWIFAVNLENHAITISSAAKHAIYVFFVDREMRGIAGDPLATSIKLCSGGRGAMYIVVFFNHF
ncbi:hypothetical protein LAZ67_X003822 [Cordylochernes scorpioides]|uniref:Reverse transcriptase domain-containing protein n=1 Tax=Cordylochernes scorpioides TaxID=51811 RepID=A0ABY6LUQ1_9ARAC|nr:hypothetical protein LAZ67_X003822 [Cordylochernes scorpioides]